MTLVLKHPDGPQAEDFKLSRRALGATFFAGYAVAALSAEAEPIVTDEAGLITETAILAPPDGFKLAAYVARPQGGGRHPAVLVVSEIFGVHAYIKDICRRLAKLGYVAIAPAFFTRVADPAPLTDFPAIIKIVNAASDQQVMADVGAAITWLKHQSFVDAKRLAVTGFCWGGGVTWLACEAFAEFRCGAAWYGRMVPPKDLPAGDTRMWPVQLVKRLQGPVLGLYGGKDRLAEQVPAMREALAAAGKTDSSIIVYADADHGFHADYRPSYNAADAKDAWAKMLAHFKAHGV
jgi:carboxymethylenebutenolidase